MYVWPEGQPMLRVRVVSALSLLVASKLVNIQVPFLFKAVVDALTPATDVVVESSVSLAAGFTSQPAVAVALTVTPLALLVGCECGQWGTKVLNPPNTHMPAPMLQMAWHVSARLHSPSCGTRCLLQWHSVPSALSRSTCSATCTPSISASTLSAPPARCSVPSIAAAGASTLCSRRSCSTSYLLGSRSASCRRSWRRRRVKKRGVREWMCGRGRKWNELLSN
jgi:hypothetical protein